MTTPLPSDPIMASIQHLEDALKSANESQSTDLKILINNSLESLISSLQKKPETMKVFAKWLNRKDLILETIDVKIGDIAEHLISNAVDPEKLSNLKGMLYAPLRLTIDGQPNANILVINTGSVTPQIPDHLKTIPPEILESHLHKSYKIVRKCMIFVHQLRYAIQHPSIDQKDSEMPMNRFIEYIQVWSIHYLAHGAKIPVQNHLPLTLRGSFGFSNTTCVECLTALRLTVGLEDPIIHDGYVKLFQTIDKDISQALQNNEFKNILQQLLELSNEDFSKRLELNVYTIVETAQKGIDPFIQKIFQLESNVPDPNRSSQ